MIKMDRLQLNWKTGTMTIDLLTFFPTTQIKLQKLLKIIQMDKQAKDHIKSLIKYLKSLLLICDDYKEHYKCLHTEAKQIMREYEEAIDIGLLDDNLSRGLKTKHRLAKQRVYRNKKWIEYYIRTEKQIQRNIEQLENEKAKLNAKIQK